MENTFRSQLKLLQGCSNRTQKSVCTFKMLALCELRYLSRHIAVLLYVCDLSASGSSYSCPHYNITDHGGSRTRL